MSFVQLKRLDEGLHRCGLCDSNSDKYTTYYKDTRNNDVICLDCKRCISSSYWDFYTGGYTDAADLTQMLREMEDRFPDLFVGPVCPKADLLCDCTYASGCKALDKSVSHVSVGV